MIIRTLRAVLVTALTWGVAWAVVGATIGLLEEAAAMQRLGGG